MKIGIRLAQVLDEVACSPPLEWSHVGRFMSAISQPGERFAVIRWSIGADLGDHRPLAYAVDAGIIDMPWMSAATFR
jgi:hypothetical protein